MSPRSAPLGRFSIQGMDNMRSKVWAPACVRIGHWDKPDQTSSFGLTIRSKDSRPCFNLLEEGLANSDRLSVPSLGW
jgi:hypothetical protein